MAFRQGSLVTLARDLGDQATCGVASLPTLYMFCTHHGHQLVVDMCIPRWYCGRREIVDARWPLEY
jgi:hypothetical protein